MRVVLILWITLLVAIVSFFTAALEFNYIAFGLSLIGAGLLVYVTYLLTQNWVTLSVVFTAFFLLYGLSGPFAVLFTPGRLPSPFYPPYHVSPWLQAFSLALAGLASGFLMGISNRSLPRQVPSKLGDWLSTYSFSFWGAATVLIAMASIGVWVDFIRIGGILFSKKSLVQQAIDELYLSFPGDYFIHVGVGALGLWWAVTPKNHIAKVRLTVSLVLLLPYIVFNSSMGERDGIIMPILMFLVGYCVIKPLRSLSTQMIMAVIVIYVASAFIMAHRTNMLVWLSQGQPFSLDMTSFYLRLNPGFIEFGCSFGTFNAYLNNWDQPPLLGQSYWTDLLSVIPRWLYPGEKPKTIGKIFHEEIYGSEFAKVYRILGAGVGSSAIAIVHLNFREPGLFFVYFLVAILITSLERKIRSNTSLFWILFYMVTIPSAISWHRSSHIFYYLFYGIILIFTFEVIRTILNHYLIKNFNTKDYP